MFRLVKGKQRIECDGECGAALYTDLRSFHQARNLSVVEGWKHQRIDGQWCNYCPRCAEKMMHRDLDRVGVHFFKASGE
jgi:hypothetical protein